MDASTPSPFYRVTIKALIRDERDRVLILQNAKGKWEMPGGGWEHDEDFADCLNRELCEELGVTTSRIGSVAFIYKCLSSRGYYVIRIMVPAQLDSTDFNVGDGMRSAQFVDRQEFLEIDFAHGEAPVREYIDQIWSTVE
jgi:8-oxo-dGTP diphosphatase